ncbi:MAG: phosphate ABC transporter substrate-binding protein [Ruminococcaceae bacterium]|nr:phosphate ABC transporter substrate-binding protein [Oscillospiraceae bacterium]
MKKAMAILLALFMLLSLCACGKDNETQNVVSPTGVSAADTPQSLHLTVDELPIIDGATALAPYYEAMAARLLGVDIEEARTRVLCSTTGAAYENLIDGKVDMVFCALPSDEQVSAARERGVEFEYHHILNGGFVFFVNKDNPVDSLTVEQLHDIYSGAITNWKELGGADEPIIAYQRDEGSGSQTGLYRFVIPKDEVMEAPTERAIADMGGIVDAVAGFDNSAGAIGYSYYYYVASMHYTDRIKLLAVEGVVPGNDTIGDGSYPFVNHSQIVIRKGTPADSNVYKVIEWVKSEEGARLAEENGYVANRM